MIYILGSVLGVCVWCSVVCVVCVCVDLSSVIVPYK